MAKIFAAQAELNNHPARNNFDLSHKVHMSGKMGTLYPVLCKPVVPGDTFRISSGCAFNFFPMPYPTQTRMRFIMHFFYVRNKNIWENWENWLQGLEEHVPPYIEQGAQFYKTGSLADFLGIPTTYVAKDPFQGVKAVGMLNGARSNSFSQLAGLNYTLKAQDELGGVDLNFYDLILNSLTWTGHINTALVSPDGIISATAENIAKCSYTRYLMMSASDECKRRDWYESTDRWEAASGRAAAFMRSYSVNPQIEYRAKNGFVEFKTGKPVKNNMAGATGFRKYCFVSLWTNAFAPTIYGNGTPVLVYNYPCEISTNENDVEVDKVFIPEEMFEFMRKMDTNNNGADYWLTVSWFNGANQTNFISNVCETSPLDGAIAVVDDEPIDVSTDETLSPYYNKNNEIDTVKISALPFRAYESIYNAFYRNQHGNQPFMIDGVTQYNKYNTTKADGADETDYKLMQRNWELDAYTSCLPSPQQGPAPVVGITALGKVTIVDPETGVTTTAQATDTSGGIQISDVNLGEESHQRYLVNLANSGITINDFRQVNALQRFLETNIRKGFRYVDFIEGHFGKRIKDAIMDMPEFIGGFSQGVDVGMISNTNGVGNQESPEALGSYAGQASAFGGSKHSITHYCDDYGFIMGIMCLVPDPTYSQILPKHFNVKQPLDYYFPEFSQIGLQPITYEELCPVQSHVEHFLDGNKKLTDVFGYQRPNHDLVWYPDTLHGEFRQTFKRFIINRLFAERPELSNEFLIIKPEETNSIFSYMAPDSDVFVGQLAFDIKAKRPVPRIVIPGLGR